MNISRKEKQVVSSATTSEGLSRDSRRIHVLEIHQQLQSQPVHHKLYQCGHIRMILWLIYSRFANVLRNSRLDESIIVMNISISNIDNLNKTLPRRSITINTCQTDQLRSWTTTISDFLIAHQSMVVATSQFWKVKTKNKIMKLCHHMFVIAKSNITWKDSWW